MLNANQVIAVAPFLATSTDAIDAWDAWQKDIVVNGGEMDASGARAFADFLDEQRSPTASSEARALLRLAQLMEANA